MRRITLVLVAFIFVVTIFVAPQKPAEAGTQVLPGGWSFTVLQYCRNGFTIFVQTPPAGIADTNGYRVSVTATTPGASPRAIFTASGPSGPQTSSTIGVYWTAPQSPGMLATVTVTMFINDANAGTAVDADLIQECSIPPPDDGRMNNIIVDPEQTVAVYCRSNGIEIIRPVGNQPVTVLFASIQEIATVGVPRTNTLIKASVDVNLYRLSSGEFQVNAPGLGGKQYVFIWSGCPGFSINTPTTSGSTNPYYPVGPVSTGGLVYLVQAGDTLALIAQRFGVSLSTLATINDIVNINQLYVGQALVIPTAYTVVPIVPTIIGVTTTTTPTNYGGQTHVVQRGENLYRIALRYGVSMSALIAANGITNPNLIYVGQVLRIP
ncbi:MAG: hypothetical protein DPW16_20425 [Chloroflexi bacterium]|nr:hypothetical protein [Chloroflexota bacterium]